MWNNLLRDQGIAICFADYFPALKFTTKFNGTTQRKVTNYLIRIGSLEIH